MGNDTSGKQDTQVPKLKTAMACLENANSYYVHFVLRKTIKGIATEPDIEEATTLTKNIFVC